MKKLVALLVVLGLLIGVAGIYAADAAVAKKAPAKKAAVKKPAKKAPAKAAPKKAAPAPAPVAPVVPPPPPAPVAPAPAPVPAPVVAKAPAGIFGWGLNSDLALLYVNDGQGLMGTIGGRMDLVFDDPMALGSIVGLSANAVKYNLGLGGVLGNDDFNKAVKMIPLYLDATVALPVGGLDTYVRGGLNYVLYGTGRKVGKYGVQAMVGIMVDMGLGIGKTGIELGYSITRADNNSVKGISLTVCQPLAL